MGSPESSWLLSLGTTVLVLTAIGGYWLGRYRLRPTRQIRKQQRPEINRALSIVGDLESVATHLRRSLSLHGSALRKFAAHLVRYERDKGVARHELCDQADEMLKPAMRLTAEISHAYAQLAQQMTHLATFAELRTDPITGTANRLALEETVDVLLSEQGSHTVALTLAMIDIDFFAQQNDARNPLHGDRVLNDLVEVLRATIRQCDLLARYGGDAFVIVMPRTEPCAAAELAERIRTAVQNRMSITVSIGLAASVHGDAPNTLLGRADAALAEAKSAGRNCVYLLEGTSGHVVGVKDDHVPQPRLLPATNPGKGNRTIVDGPVSQSASQSAPRQDEASSPAVDKSPVAAAPR
jgi:diguanylate cyclase (GGDEF)-like protein